MYQGLPVGTVCTEGQGVVNRGVGVLQVTVSEDTELTLKVSHEVVSVSGHLEP
jgi:hypothetical protein